MMIEVFKTNVDNPEEAERLIAELKELLPLTSINFDLEDCDKILRVEPDSEFLISSVSKHLHAAGYWCEILS